MSITYDNLICPSCASTKFKYHKDIKMWECLYCGTQIERNETMDSMYSIKNVICQCLVDIAYRRFAEAKRHLVEAEMIDSKYVGTIIAKLAYNLNCSLYDDIGEQEKGNLIAQLKKYYKVLSDMSEKPTDAELALYEFIDSSDAFAVLILLYDTLGMRERVDLLYDELNPEEIFSMSLNTVLLKFMVKHQRFDIADRIVANYENLEKKSALQFLFEQYPDGEQKAKNCSLLLAADVLDYDDKSFIEEYLSNSDDSLDTKYTIACQALKTQASPSISCLTATIITNLTDIKQVETIFSLIFEKKLNDTEKNIILEYTLSECQQEVILFIIELFQKTNQFLIFNYQNYIALFNNKKVDLEYRKKIIDSSLKFNVTDKMKDQFVSYYLNEVKEEVVDREKCIDYLLGLIHSLSTQNAEKYIIYCKLDGENKPKIVQKIFELDLNLSFFRETFDKYVSLSSDSMRVSEQIFAILSSKGLGLSEENIVKMLLRNDLPQERKVDILRNAYNTGTQYFSALDQYIAGVSINTFSATVFDVLLSHSSSVSANSFIKFLFNITDSQVAKVAGVTALMRICTVQVQLQNVKVYHLNNAIDCSLLQAYLLTTPDCAETTINVLNALGAQNMKMNSDILVSGVKYKFKKYININRGQLSNATQAACAGLRMI